MRIRDIVKSILIERENRKYRKCLADRKLTYTGWVKRDEAAKKVRGREENTNFVIWKQAKGQLAKEARQQVAAYFGAHPECSIVYGDEDVLKAGGQRENPWIKPCWSPDTYLSYFYPGSVIAVRKSLLTEAGIDLKTQEMDFDQVSRIRPFMDRLFALAGGFDRSGKGIARVPYILFHVSSEDVWEDYFRSAGDVLKTAGDNKGDQAEAAGGRSGDTVQTAGDSKGEELRKASGSAGVSVIIPSKDNPGILENCMNSLKKLHADLEIIVVDNGSKEENRQRIKEMTSGMKYIYQPMEFNFSFMCNTGAENATKELLLFLNDDIVVCEDDWLQTMSDMAVRPFTGAVGMKLYYPDSRLIQHAGVVNLPIGPDHKLLRFSDEPDYYFRWNRYRRNCLAVTGACLMVEKRKFQQVGGFRTELEVNYNDVDLCMRLYERGYHNVVLNDHYAYHYESLSRGINDRPEKMERLTRERELLYRLHPGIRDTDPYFPRELDRWGLHSKILPAYAYGIYHLQPACWKDVGSMEKLRYDECLMVRVEICNEETIQGFGIVLGDNNACYRRYLLLSPADEGQEAERQLTEGSLIAKITGVYRRDLEENVPDQVNVALGGFCIQRDDRAITSGRYRIGMLAVHKITGGKLFAWSGKDLTVKQEE